MNSQIFENLKKVGSYNYLNFFSKVEKKLIEFTSSTTSNMNSELVVLSNIIFLLSETIERSFLERTPFLNKATNH
jgi:hypothetical protein